MAKRNSILKRAAGQKHFKYLAGYYVHGMYLGGYIIEKKLQAQILAQI